MNAPHRVGIGWAVPLLLMLATLLGTPARADDKCTADKLQLDRMVTPEVSLGKRLTLHLAKLTETARADERLSPAAGRLHLWQQS